MLLFGAMDFLNIIDASLWQKPGAFSMQKSPFFGTLCMVMLHCKGISCRMMAEDIIRFVLEGVKWYNILCKSVIEL